MPEPSWETVQSESFNRMGGCTLGGELGKNFTHECRKLEAVPRAPRADQDVWITRMWTNQKVKIGGECVHAGCATSKGEVGARHIGLEPRLQLISLAQVQGAVDAVGVGVIPMRVIRHLDRGTVAWETVVLSVVVDVYR